METTDEPDPASLAAFNERHAQVNGEASTEAQDGAYDIPAPPSPEEADRAAEARPCLTAFMVVVEEDGTAWATNNIELPVAPSRQPSLGDMYRSCSEVMKDIQTMEITQRTVQTLAQVWPQIAAQQAENERQNKIANKLMQKGIHVPGRS